ATPPPDISTLSLHDALPILTFAIVGGGPTGVEMAGQIAELARDTLSRDFRSVDPRTGRILLIEASDRVLTSFPPSLSAKAERARSEEHTSELQSLAYLVCRL